MSGRFSRREAIKTCSGLALVGVLNNCGFKYRSTRIQEGFGEGKAGFLAKVSWVKEGFCTLVYTREGKPVVLVKKGGEIKAFVSICPHTECEVNDGERYQPLVKGEIRCLIHDSFFNSESGGANFRAGGEKLQSAGF